MLKPRVVAVYYSRRAIDSETGLVLKSQYNQKL